MHSTAATTFDSEVSCCTGTPSTVAGHADVAPGVLRLERHNLNNAIVGDPQDCLSVALLDGISVVEPADNEAWHSLLQGARQLEGGTYTA